MSEGCLCFSMVTRVALYHYGAEEKASGREKLVTRKSDDRLWLAKRQRAKEPKTTVSQAQTRHINDGEGGGAGG